MITYRRCAFHRTRVERTHNHRRCRRRRRHRGECLDSRLPSRSKLVKKKARRQWRWCWCSRNANSCVTGKINAAERSREKAVTVPVIKQRYPLSNHSRHGRLCARSATFSQPTIRGLFCAKNKGRYTYRGRRNLQKIKQNFSKTHKESSDKEKRQLVKLKIYSMKI